MSVNRLIILLLLCTSSKLSLAQTTGSFQGKIIEQSTKQPVGGANIQVGNTTFGAVTDSTGAFNIEQIPVGSYPITISRIGFQTKIISEVIITANKTYYS